jgi:hypothetical protein
MKSTIRSSWSCDLLRVGLNDFKLNMMSPIKDTLAEAFSHSKMTHLAQVVLVVSGCKYMQFIFLFRANFYSLNS